MVKLADEDIKTREVLEWRGVHLLHAPGSSCSQKTRIFLNLKGIPWESHVIDLKSSANLEPWYLGINPRGLVPCLVHNGAVHIESNDIIEYLEEAFPEPPLIPADSRERVHELLQMEDDLHRDLRILTFRYVIPTRTGEMKTPAALQSLQQHDGTIGGRPDPHKDGEIRFWEAANESGISDAQVAESVTRFRAALDRLDETLQRSDYVLGTTLTVVDIAWYVYAARLIAAGYPLHLVNEHVGKWFDRLDVHAEFNSEVEMPAGLKEASAALQQSQSEQGRSLGQIAGL